jgi:hypothetical protein
MLKLTRWQRRMIAEKLVDVANVAAGAMIFGQFLAGRGFSLRVAIYGLTVWTGFFACAIALTQGDPS